MIGTDTELKVSRKLIAKFLPRAYRDDRRIFKTRTEIDWLLSREHAMLQGLIYATATLKGVRVAARKSGARR